MDANQPEDLSLIARDDHKPHPWPEFDADYCSCCTQRFIHGMTNVMRIAKAPETVLDLDGKVLGLNKNAPAFKAVLHALCWKRHYGKQAECEKCGGFCRPAMLSDGTKNPCMCTCHTGSNFCSLILEPNAANKQPLM